MYVSAKKVLKCTRHDITSEEYYSRRDADFNYNAKNDRKIKTASEKLFKFNGKISVDNWIEYSSHFMTANPLVHEYFEGSYPEHISEIVEAVRKSKTIRVYDYTVNFKNLML